MHLYIVRHTEAEYYSNPESGERELSAEGKQILNAVAPKWLNFIKKPDAIVSSPIHRALETAKIIKECIGFGQEIDIQSIFDGTGTIDDWTSYLNSLDADNILVVSHEPSCSQYLSMYISHFTAEIVYKPATISGITFTGRIRKHSGSLLFTVPPDVLLK
ncbi:MAG: histidine phosphatase family protein [Ignavibacteriaceae bacterium]|nr:histidine phosphatase family protein [Ignavibacteriaceae bacterium]